MPDQPAALDKDFTGLVAQYVRGHLPQQFHDTLLADENLDRLYYALTSLKKDVEAQLSSQKSRWITKREELNKQGDDGTAWEEFKASESEWRVRAIYFLKSIEEHIAAVKERKKTHHGGETYRQAIMEHAEEIDDNDASPADRKLWSSI